MCGKINWDSVACRVSQNAASGAEANIRGLMGLGGGVSCNERQFLVWYELSQG